MTEFYGRGKDKLLISKQHLVCKIFEFFTLSLYFLNYKTNLDLNFDEILMNAFNLRLPTGYE